MELIEGLVVGEVHPPEPRTSPIGHVECDMCNKKHVIHQLEALSMRDCKCGGFFRWYPKKAEGEK